MTTRIKTFDVPALHPAGWPFVGIAVILWVLFTWTLDTFGFFVGLLAVGAVASFFRDPERVSPRQNGLILSPADGKVCDIRQAAPPVELGMGSDPVTRISIFLSLLNVHVNRVPCDGVIVSTHYRPGLFVNAALDKASTDNERLAVRQRLSDGREIAYVQIAGLVARRILSDLQPGDSVRAGQRFGIIRFGSRAEVYLPPGLDVRVEVGQTMIGGETVLADLTLTPPSHGTQEESEAA